MNKPKALILASNAGAYCYPWANSPRTRIVTPSAAFERPAAFFDYFDKIILVNGISDKWLFHPRWQQRPRPDTFFFLWDPARCPYYAPSRDTLEQLKQLHKVFSFQREDCEAFGLRFNSTMYAPPPPGFFAGFSEACCDVLFLGVPKDRMPLLRALHAQIKRQGLRPYFRIGLTPLDDGLPEQDEGWLVTREWMRYDDYLRMSACGRCLLDLYQAIQTGFSLRVMEHIFFGKKLITNNRVIKHAGFYHPNNIFLLHEDDISGLKEWLGLPFSPIAEEVKEYYTFEKWVERFE